MKSINDGKANPFQDILDQIIHMKELQASGAPFNINEIRKLEILTDNPRWEPFYGYNRFEIPNFEIKWGGGVSFKDHIGKPLSDRLWKDVTMRLQAKYIQIYQPNDGIPCVATSEGQCDIYLDEDGLVSDIYFTPYRR